LIAWKEYSENQTIQTGDTWHGKKGLLMTIAANPTVITFEPPGDKIGAEIWVAVKATGGGGWKLRFVGNPLSCLQDQATNHWQIDGLRVVCRFVAVSKTTWCFAVINGADAA
jgi:hypothetical protein